MKIYYLAHPVRPDSQFTEKQNLEDVIQIQKLLWDCGVWTIIPWYTNVLIRPNTVNIDEYLVFDEECVRRCDGIILSGHRLSDGMKAELKAAREAGLDVINLIGVSHKHIANEILREVRPV